MNHSGGGIALGFLASVFISLKLFNAVDWSWWWVLSPILLSILIGGIGDIVSAALSERD